MSFLTISTHFKKNYSNSVVFAAQSCVALIAFAYFVDIIPSCFFLQDVSARAWFRFSNIDYYAAISLSFQLIWLVAVNDRRFVSAVLIFLRFDLRSVDVFGGSTLGFYIFILSSLGASNNLALSTVDFISSSKEMFALQNVASRNLVLFISFLIQVSRYLFWLFASSNFIRYCSHYLFLPSKSSYNFNAYSRNKTTCFQRLVILSADVLRVSALAEVLLISQSYFFIFFIWLRQARRNQAS